VATDDIKVGLKVTLDEQSMAREVAKAESQVNRGKGGPGGGKSGGGGSASDLAEGLRNAVTKPIVDKLQKIEEKLTGVGASANQASRFAQAFLLFKLLQEVYYAIKSILASVWNLAQSLTRFTPILAVAFRNLQIMLRMLAIDLGRLIGKELANLVDFIRELISFLYTYFRPHIKVAAMILDVIVNALRTFLKAVIYVTVQLLRTMAIVVKGIADLMKWLSGWMIGLGAQIMSVMGVVLDQLSKKIDKFADSVEQSANTGRSAVQAMNAALIKGFSDVGKMAYTGVKAPGQGEEQNAPQFIAPLKMDSHGNQRTYKTASNSVATNRKTVPVQTPALASVVNNVQLKAEVKLQHEEAVQRAIEEVRSCLVKAIHGVRNEQILLSSKIYAKTAIDL
jgi:hypothetical protein